VSVREQPENKVPPAKKRRSKVAAICGPLRDSIRATIGGDIVSRGAALSFYTFFAIAPLFVIVLAVTGMVFGREASQRALYGQVSELAGNDAAQAIRVLVAAASKPKTGVWATTLAVVTLVAGATGVFVELQNALNSIWGVKRHPGRGLRYFVTARLLSFALILGIGFLLFVSLVLSAAVSALGKFMVGMLPGEATLWQGVNFGISFGVITLLFAMIFKLLPDLKIAWRDVWVGSVITALLFNLGNLVLGLYLGRSGVASAYGAAGSLVVLLLWVYYSSQILFIGAKFTQIYSSQRGSHPAPRPGPEVATPKNQARRDHDNRN
jgi:membrane protein